MPPHARSLRTGLTAAALLWLLPACAGAVRVAGVATGVIAEQAYTEGEGAEVFGLDQTGLLGAEFRIDFAYDTDLAPPDANPAPDRANHLSENASPDWLDLAIAVNGHTVVLRGDHRYADTLDGTAENGAGVDRVQLSILFEHFEPTAPPFTVHRREFLDFMISMPDDTLSSAMLPSALASDEIIRVFNSANFSLNEFDVDPDTDALTYLRVVQFSMDIRHVSASPVPEPGSAALLAAGLVALAASRRIAARDQPLRE